MKTLQQIRESKIQLEKDMKSLIEKFEKENDVYIRDINFFETSKTLAETKPIYTLSVDIKL